MLGRICMTLEPEGSTALTDDPQLQIRYIQKENFGGLKYIPSYNIAPGEVAPIMISSQHFDSEENEFFYAIHPAIWGLIPRWHKGAYNEHGFNTTNFRSENMNESRMYKPAFIRGRRCAIVCEGYYEHQRVPYRLPQEERSIYYIYAKQAKGVEIHDRTTWSCGQVNLLFIAGVFDLWTDADNREVLSFTMLSMASEKNSLSWLHPRTPVLLESAHQIYQWLNFSLLGDEMQTLKLIRHPKSIKWHEVSAYVLSARNKDSKCNKPLRDIKCQRESDDNEDL